MTKWGATLPGLRPPSLPGVLRLDDLAPQPTFVSRHVATSAADQQVMLAAIGVDSLETLVAQTVPASIRSRTPLALPGPRHPDEVLATLRRMLSATAGRRSLIGQGYYGTQVPPVIQRNVLEHPGWYTAYTPYQPEISQGRLETLLNFQTLVAELTGLELANASLLDEATAAAEAMTMARRLSKSQHNRFLIDADTHPQTIAVVTTRAEPLGIEVVVGDVAAELGDGAFGALLSLPTSTGAVPDWSAVIEAIHGAGALAVVATDLLACVLTTPPGSMGADIAVGSAQRFGVPMGFGGPHAGFMATSSAVARSLPGRLVGVSTDTAGRPALRLALQTREQHIRREKATSNICTAQVLLANLAGLYASWHGPDGLRVIAERVHGLAGWTAAALSGAGLAVRHDTWFDTITVDGVDAGTVLAEARRLGYNLRHVADDAVGMSFDELSGPADVRAVLAAFGVTEPETATVPPSPLPRRTDQILRHPAFTRYHSEHDMLRYLRRLVDRDLALDRTMIPLGSCTMKLNATVEMVPITWPELTELHPFGPPDESEGIRRMIAELESMLVAVTGYDAVSLQPNAGSQGELAGLLAIRAYHLRRGDAQRTICLIPSSAHGTNAASAVMAGMQVRVVACDATGNVDLADLRAKIDAAGDQLAAAMITYPSTHGVFEEAITEICDAVHAGGGQVYVDGANLNALVGLAQPGRFGADVSHLNLHKTFCIPHGGGGPGVGPVAVRQHLAEFLPGGGTVGPVSGAPFGSALILPISWVYIACMGASGLTDATAAAILHANYLAAKLDPSFPVLYRGEGGRVGHECIVDLRPITKATGVTVDDVAKRLIDYGFHAPTMSFPVAGTLMIEPTESEPLAELDRFVEAMVSIRAEIDQVADGTWPADDNPLCRAPHTAEDLLGTWDRPYSRELGAFPVPALRRSKYFPPVSRIDSAYGDRHLVCSCEPLEAYADQRG